MRAYFPTSLGIVSYLIMYTVHGEAKGVGISEQKGAAKDIAAYEALKNLGLLIEPEPSHS